MQITASQIAAMTGGIVEGDGTVAVSSFAKIEEGHPGAVSFLANPRYTHYIYETKSSVVLVNKNFHPESPVNCTLIKVDDPYATVAELMKFASKMLQPNPVGVEQPSFIAEGVELPDDVYVGAFAYIGKDVKLAKGVKIFPNAYIGDKCEIGEETIVYPGVKIYHGCSVGRRCVIHSGAVIGADGFGFAPVNGEFHKIPQLGNVIIEDDVEIGANTTVDRATMGHTRVGKGTKLDNLIQVAHNCAVGQNTVMAAQTGIAGSTKIGSNCMIGGQVGFAGHIEIGDNVQIGAQSGIPANVKSGARIIGTPAVDGRNYARQVVNIKNLQSLYDRVKALEEMVKKQNNL